MKPVTPEGQLANDFVNLPGDVQHEILEELEIDQELAEQDDAFLLVLFSSPLMRELVDAAKKRSVQ